jgi:geranylgeranyl pyrophosphate synthase
VKRKKESIDLEAYLETQGAEIQRALERAMSRLQPDISPDIGVVIQHGLMSGGKRLRPILFISAYQACGGVVSAATYDLAASLEFVHAYSLMHDDLPCMDNADLRRGRPTTHLEHGEELTIVAGAALIPAAAMQALSACAALGISDERSIVLTQTLLEAAGAGGMIGGQWLDLLAEGSTPPPEGLDDLHNRKTGALLAASLVMGGLAANAVASTLSALDEFGKAIGLAFQITDDVLDATQSPEALGKNPSDTELDKATYVALYGIQKSRRMAAEASARAQGALLRAGVEAPMLLALASFVVDRER